MEMTDILATQLYNRYSKYSEKLHTHKRHINEEQYTSVFSFFVTTFLFIVCVKNTNKKVDNISDLRGDNLSSSCIGNSN